MTLTLKIVKKNLLSFFLYDTLAYGDTMCNYHTKFGHKRFSGSEDSIHINSQWKFEMRTSALQTGVGIAQLVEARVSNWTGQPYTILTWEGSSRWCRKGCFHQSIFNTDSSAVSVQPSCAIACTNICEHVKNPQSWQPYHCLDTQKCCTHSSEWVALLLQLLCCTWVRLFEFLQRAMRIFLINFFYASMMM